jgi:hypothetical protein
MFKVRALVLPHLDMLRRSSTETFSISALHMLERAVMEEFCHEHQ